MVNVKVAFRILDDRTCAPHGYPFVKLHIIYDVKMEGFRREAWLVAGGHMTTAPSAVAYVSVVPHKSVKIALTLVALNDLEVKCGNILNTYITAPVKEKVWAFVCPEHNKNAGNLVINREGTSPITYA